MKTINTSEAFESGIESWPDSSATGEVFARPALYAIRSDPNWVAERRQRIDRLGRLAPDWDSYGARKVEPLSMEFAKQALSVLGTVVGVESPAISATPEGFVSLSWDNGNSSMDVDFLPDGRMAYACLNAADSSRDDEGTTRELGRILALLIQW